ncbi:MAG: hypothetical protein HXX16_02600 [Bacteroidales bacterium]|nr:hypothetical protein [Bacteroidales bacterium]
MIKEIIIHGEGRGDIQKISIGVFPAKGRYYRKKMLKKDDFFIVELDLPLGISYYHLYLNDDFTTEYVDISSPLMGQDLKSRVPIIIKSEIFTHLYFNNDPRFISYIKDDLVEFKAISYYSWINEVKLVNEGLEEIEFDICFEYRNIKFWNLRYKKREQKKFAIKFGAGEREYWLLDKNRASKDYNEDVFFNFPKNNSKVPFSGVGYQIFPDTFWKSENQINDSNFQEWGSLHHTYTWYGGDINGIIEKIPLIIKLGVKFIYLNPIFHAKSAHRYDTIDYRVVDPVLGSQADFKKLVEKIHSEGLKVILDISINHCSVDFFAFKDILRFQEKSKYRDWFIIETFPVSIDEINYSCWHGYKELPQFNINNTEVQSYLIESAIFWITKHDIDGWRIDVSSEMPDSFVYKFIKAVKDTKKEILLIGENLHDNPENFVDKAGGDGITAYGLYIDVFKSFFLDKRITLVELATKLMEYNYSHSFWTVQHSWNFLSNHDLPRFYYELENKKDYLLAFCLLLAIPGTPILYYGEEHLLSGEIEDNRCSMNWNGYNLDSKFIKFFQKLIGIRSQFKEVFDYGNIEIPYVDSNKGILIIARKFKMSIICFVINSSEKEVVINTDVFISSYGKSEMLMGARVNAQNIEVLEKSTTIIQFDIFETYNNQTATKQIQSVI